MTRYASLLPLLALSLLALPAHAAKVQTASDPEADFSTFRTFAWRPSEAADPGVGPEVRSSANRVLTDKGLRRVEPDQDPDIWLEFAVGSADMLYADWKYELGWWNTLWRTGAARSRVSGGVLVVISSNGRGTEDDAPVWGGRVIMEGNNPDALMVMAGRAGKEVAKMMKKYPGLK